MTQLNINLNTTVVPNEIRTKRVSNLQTNIVAEDNQITIKFSKDIQLSRGYIDQTAAFLRTYAVLTGTVTRVETIRDENGNSVDPEALEAIRFQSLLFADGQRTLPPILDDLSTFFAAYRSRLPQYRYINATVPWFVLYLQALDIINRLRTLFTIVEMLGRYHAVPQAQTIDCFRSLLQHGFEQGVPYNDLVQLMHQYHDADHAPRQGYGFTHIMTLMRDVIAQYHDQGDEECVVRFIYALRNKYFHGNVSPVLAYAGDSRIAVSQAAQIVEQAALYLLKTICMDVL